MKQASNGEGGDRAASSGSLESPAPSLQPVPIVSMDYFYLSRSDEVRMSGLDGMSTKELNINLRKPDAGRRNALKERVKEYSQDEDKSEGLEEDTK